MPEISIVRDEAGRHDRTRAYRVMLDDAEVGRINRGETLTVTAEPGQHRLYFKIDWCRSPYIDLDLTDGGPAAVRCWPNSMPFGALYYASFGRAKYIGAELTAG